MEKMTDLDMDAESALNTLLEAERVKCDPELMKKVAELALKKKKTLSSIADLKGVYQDKYAKLPEEDMGDDAEDAAASKPMDKLKSKVKDKGLKSK